MRKSFIFIISFFLIAILTGCATQGTAASYDPLKTDEVLNTTVYEDDVISALASYSSLTGQFKVTIKNKTDRFLKLDYNESAYVANGISTKVCDGETRKIDAAKTQALISIPPKSSIERVVCNADDSSARFILKEDSILYLAIVDDSSLIHCTLDFSPEVAETNGEKTVLGTVSESFTQWHFLFTGDTMQNAKIKLLAKAMAEYGTTEVYLENIKYEGEWSPLSLVLYFNMFGFVEKVNASAEVVAYK